MREVMDELLVVDCQYHLAQIVTGRLEAIDPAYKISGQRLRKIVANMDGYGLEVHCRTSHVQKPYQSCPVCGSTLSPIKNETLYGWEVTIGQKCMRCPFWTGEDRRVPVKYVFHKKRKRRRIRSNKKRKK